MKKILAFLLVLCLVLAYANIAMAESSYSAGSVYHTFTTAAYESLYPGLMWRHATCYAYTQSGSGNSGIYYDGVKSTSNYQLFRPVDASGGYLGEESSVFTGQYARAYCDQYMYASRMHLKISKPSGLGESVKMSTYGYFTSASGT